MLQYNYKQCLKQCLNAPCRSVSKAVLKASAVGEATICDAAVMMLRRVACFGACGNKQFPRLQSEE